MKVLLDERSAGMGPACRAMADFLRRELKFRGMTQTQLAQQINTHPNTVANWVKGRNIPSQEFALEMCVVLADSHNWVELADAAREERLETQQDRGRLTIEAAIRFDSTLSTTQKQFLLTAVAFVRNDQLTTGDITHAVSQRKVVRGE